MVRNHTGVRFSVLVLTVLWRPYVSAAASPLGPRPPQPPQLFQALHDPFDVNLPAGSENHLYPTITSSEYSSRNRHHDLDRSWPSSLAQSSSPRLHQSHNGYHESTSVATSTSHLHGTSYSAGNPEILEADGSATGIGVESNTFDILAGPTGAEVSRTTYYAYDTNIGLTSSLQATFQSVQPSDDSAMTSLKLLSTAHPSSLLPKVLAAVIPGLIGALVILYLLYRYRQTRARELPGSVRLPDVSDDEFLTESRKAVLRLSSNSGLGICMQSLESGRETEFGNQATLASLGSSHSFGSYSSGAHVSNLYESSHHVNQHSNEPRDIGGILRTDGYHVVENEAVLQHEGPTPPPKDSVHLVHLELEIPWKKNAYFPSRNELLGFVFPPTAVAVQRDLLVSGKMDPQECISPLDVVSSSSLSSQCIPAISSSSSSWMLSSSSNLVSSTSSRVITPSTSNTFAPSSSSNMMASSTFGVIASSSSSSRSLTATRPLNLQRKVVKVSSKLPTLKSQLVPKKRFSPKGDVLYSTGGGDEGQEDALDSVQEEANGPIEGNEENDLNITPLPSLPASSSPPKILGPPRTPQQSQPLWAGYNNRMYAAGPLNEQTPLASSNSYTSHSPQMLRRRSSPMISQRLHSPRSPMSPYSPHSPANRKMDNGNDSPDQEIWRKMARASVASPTIAGIGLAFQSPQAKRRGNAEDDDRGFAQFVRDLYEKQTMKKGLKGTAGSIGVNGIGSVDVRNRESIKTIKEVDETTGEDEDDLDLDLAEELGIDVDMYMQMDMEDNTTKDLDIEVDKYKRVEIGKDINMYSSSTGNKDINMNADMDTNIDKTAKNFQDSYSQGSQRMILLLPPPSFGADLNDLAAYYGVTGSNGDIGDGRDGMDHGDITHGAFALSTPPLSAESIGLAI